MIYEDLVLMGMDQQCRIVEMSELNDHQKSAIMEKIRHEQQQKITDLGGEYGRYSPIVHIIKIPTKMAGQERELINLSVVPFTSRKQ